MPASRAGHRHHHRWYDHDWFRLRFLVQTGVAPSAVIVGSTELNQQAMIATDDFPGIYWGKSRSHRVVGVPELATPYSQFRNRKLGGEIPTARSIWGIRPVEVKVKIEQPREFRG